MKASHLYDGKYILLTQICLANSINDYYWLKVRVVCVGNF